VLVDQASQHVLHMAHDGVEIADREHTRLAASERDELSAQRHSFRRCALH
jgi:hypothetical protein